MISVFWRPRLKEKKCSVEANEFKRPCNLKLTDIFKTDKYKQLAVSVISGSNYVNKMPKPIKYGVDQASNCREDGTIKSLL